MVCLSQARGGWGHVKGGREGGAEEGGGRGREGEEGERALETTVTSNSKYRKLTLSFPKMNNKFKTNIYNLLLKWVEFL